MTTPIIKVRITNADYAIQPRGEFDNTSLSKVPVIRIFGLASNGHKTCVHIHQVYPYFYVEYKGSMKPEAVNKYVFKLQQSLNHAVAISMRRNPLDTSSRYIRTIHIVKGVHFYGFHCAWTPFLKIHLVDPGLTFRVVTILRSGGVMQRRFEVYESHLSYLLQFMCDYGLYGCGELEIAQAAVRERTAADSCDDDIDTSRFSISPHQRESNLPLELDVTAYHILNPRLLAPRNIHNTLSIPALPLPEDPLVLSVRELWEDERKRRLAKGLQPTPVLPTGGTSPRGNGPGWRAEPRLREELQQRIEQEAKDGHDVYELPSQDWARFVMTAFESREALWPSEYRMWTPETENESPFNTPEEMDAGARPMRENGKTDATVEIDEELLTSQRIEDPRSAYGRETGSEDMEEDDDGLEGPDPLPNSAPGTPVKHPIDRAAQFDTPPVSRTPSRQPSELRTPSRTSSIRSLTPTRYRSPLIASHTLGDVTPTRKRSNPFSEQSWNAPLERTSSLKKALLSPLVKRASSNHQAAQLASKSKPKRSAQSVLGGRRSVDSARVRSSPSSEEGDRADPAWAPVIPLTEPSSPTEESFNPTPNVTGLPTSSFDFEALQREQDAKRPPQDTDLFSPLSSGDASLGITSLVKLFDTTQSVTLDNVTTQSHSDAGRARKRRKVATTHHGNVGLGFYGTDGWRGPSFDSTGDSASGANTENRPLSSSAYAYPLLPPTSEEVMLNLVDLGIKETLYRDPYYSNVVDAPKRPLEYAGRLFHLKGGTGVGSLEDWAVMDDWWDDAEDPSEAVKKVSPSKRAFHTSTEPKPGRYPLIGRGVAGWEYAGGVQAGPPSRHDLVKWLKETDGTIVETTRAKRLNLQSQIAGPTQKNKHGLRASQKSTNTAAGREQQNMSVLSIEIFSLSRGDLLPDPEHDRIECIFYAFQEDDVMVTDPAERRASYLTGCFALESPQLCARRMRDTSIRLFDTELDLINAFVDQVQGWDPDILSGWELQNGSWGYLVERMGRTFEMSISDLVSRVRTSVKRENRLYDKEHTSTFKVAGRHVLNTWRIMRAEQALLHYTLENVAFHLLHRRIPEYSTETLTRWFNSDTPGVTARVLDHFIDRTTMVLEILDEAQVVTKNAEFARVFGVEFFSVLSRGSQFKVESFMFRIAKPESLMLISPSKDNVGRQNAAEAVPLIMEPKSAFYKSPLVVLDFQSLYPSIMIAYNYCYSTCLGRIGTFKGKRKFGILDDLELPPGLLRNVEDYINIAPNGIMYVKPTVRKSLLAKMLTELLDTRIMVKQAMKTSKGDQALLRILDARQLSLKFICNVTYGYTSASFSGRMPAVEIADSIVQSGRETLEHAVTTINTTSRWGAKVVYGDTDSLFISLEGKTKEQAFRIGNEMADAITAMNPRPVKLKFEKVYFPCVLLAKKRYVGFKYENPDDVEPLFDAKGIETVRRDGVPAGQKMVEKCIKILFRTQDLSEVKEYCRSSWTKLMDGRVSLQDFIFAKEVKMGKYSDKGPPPPGVVVAARRLARDPRAEAQYGDRIPYVITRGEPKQRLVDRAFEPLEVLKDRHQYLLDASYYIEHMLIPPLERVFNLVGANVGGWYAEMPKFARPVVPDSLVPQRKEANTEKGVGPSKPKFTIEEHFKSIACVICGKASSGSQAICNICAAQPEKTIFAMELMHRGAQKRLVDVQRICASCSAIPQFEEVECVSLDCAWMFERHKAMREVKALEGIPKLVGELEGRSANVWRGS
ncbi:DNA polymerase zeta [Tulasnella sp. JGI-2019a]|nr:DNA polymerase zeta [Tulasnella sp. JGI-2019a]